MNRVLNALWNGLSMSVVLFYVLPLCMYLWTSNPFHLTVWAGYVATTIFSEGLKHGVIREKSPRPEGASDCNLWCNNGPQGGRPGMPSSHSAEAVFLATTYGSQGSPVLWWIYAALVMFSRYAKQCHSVSQLMVGAAVGALTGGITLRFV
jgi:membrane-associated phospholipid phosphatase